MTNDTLSEVIGVPVALQKQKAAQQSSISVPQDTNTSMDQAMQPAGISALRTNLPTQMAKGGIIAFSGQGQSLVPSTEPEAESTPKSPKKTLSDILAEVRSAYKDTDRPTPERLAYMEAIKSGAYKPEDIKKQTGLRILQAGLGVMGGRSPNALENIASGVAPAVEGYAKDVEKYKAAKLGEMKSLADLAEAQRLEKRGDVKTAADLYSKQLDREQRLATASQKDMVVYAQQYLQMMRAQGSTDPDSVLLNQGMKEYLKEYGQNAAKIAAMLTGIQTTAGTAAASQAAGLATASGSQGIDLERIRQTAMNEAGRAWDKMKVFEGPKNRYNELYSQGKTKEAEGLRADWIKKDADARMPSPNVKPVPTPSNVPAANIPTKPGATPSKSQPVKVLPLPDDPSKLIDGEVYATKRGPGKWNAQSNVFEGQ
jgi:hypothetical protein